MVTQANLAADSERSVPLTSWKDQVLVPEVPGWTGDAGQVIQHIGSPAKRDS
jgi:hypothetical protein